MNLTYEELQIENSNLNIQELDLSGVANLKGLCVNSNIAIHKYLTNREKACILAEELGHHHTTYGDILDQKIIENRKQELRARIWAYNKQIGLLGLIKAFQSKCQNRHEVAEFLDITEEFLNEAIFYYRSKYGISTVIDNYIIIFEPNLGVIRKFENQ